MRWCRYLDNYYKWPCSYFPLSPSFSFSALRTKPFTSRHGATVHFFADANPLFALIPEPTNRPLHNHYSIRSYMVQLFIKKEVYGTIYTCYAWVYAPPTKWQCNRRVDLLTMSEYRINKHLNGVQAQATGHQHCESTIYGNIARKENGWLSRSNVSL